MSYHVHQLLKEAHRGHVGRIRRLLREGANVNSRGKYGHTPLMESASQGHLSALEYLLNSGADPGICADDNASPTFYACVNGHTKVVELLLRNGADPNAVRDCYPGLPGDTPGVSQLHVAIQRGFDGIALALINAGANIDHVCWGQTPLAAASERNMSNVAKRIREVDRERIRKRRSQIAEQGGGGNSAALRASP
jgi:ankyrin repeat protein